jgi:hypothetical protein
VHVGLSQPQLSRLIGQIEKEYNVTLLDRSTKRKAAWTQAAYRLADIYSQSSNRLQAAIFESLHEQLPKELTIGTLEGLSGIALRLVKELLKLDSVKRVEADVYDLNELEEKFLNNELDLIISVHAPGKRKPKFEAIIGYQQTKIVPRTAGIETLSPYEFGIKKNKKSVVQEKLFISNNLAMRREWIERFGGFGIIPSHVQKEKTANTEPVFIVGAENLHSSVWEVILKSI